MIICKLIGHKFKQFLQVENKDPPDYQGKKIKRSIITYFSCLRCSQSNSNTQLYCTGDQ